MATMSDPITIETLPNELLRNILSFLDVDPPSASTSELLDEPYFDLTRASDAPLKSASCVTKRWREAAIPVLFKHAKFVAREEKKVLTDQIQPFLSFVTSHKLGKVVSSLTLVSLDRKLANTQDGKYVPDCFSSFWHLLFDVIDPTVLLLIAPPQALGALTSCNVSIVDEWHFNCGCQYLRLERQDTKSEAAGKSGEGSGSASALPAEHPPVAESRDLEDWELPRAVSSTLFGIRKWTKLLLNEGSFIRGYATYEWWLRETPSILEDMLGAGMPLDYPLISPNIRDFSLIGIFPMHNHFAALTMKFPRLNNLYVQLVPRNDILQDKYQMKQVEAEDLWMERNSCYAMLMRELFSAPPSANFQELQTFESGDAADVDAWNMAVEYVKRSGNGWSIASEGVFVRDRSHVSDGTEVDADDDYGLASTFQGELVRWAWNGTMKLPVSSSSLYRAP